MIYNQTHKLSFFPNFSKKTEAMKEHSRLDKAMYTLALVWQIDGNKEHRHCIHWSNIAGIN